MEAISGVYAICNHVTGECYVGHSRDIARRWAGHRATLVSGCHSNPALQAAWDRLGLEGFGLAILEHTEPVGVLTRFASWDARRPRMLIEARWLARARLAGIVLYNDQVGHRRRAAA